MMVLRLGPLYERDSETATRLVIYPIRPPKMNHRGTEAQRRANLSLEE